MAERRRVATCPICGRAASEAHRPFCTPRCAQIDLGRWLTGDYVIPGPPLEMDEDPPPSGGEAA